MRRVIVIASRLNVLERMKEFPDLKIVKLFVQEDSLLHRRIVEAGVKQSIIRLFRLDEKALIVDEIMAIEFDLLISNGCPFILPVKKMKKGGELFVNVHPTPLPELKGKTPLSGVFMTHQEAIGATMHYIDEGIDTGAIIAQEKVRLSDDIDQGLVYKISFDLEGIVFEKGVQLLQKSNFTFQGVRQQSIGSYFNRTLELQTINIKNDTTEIIIDKIKSFGVKGQGTKLRINTNTYIIYSAEKIINEFLLSKYKNVKPGVVAFEYDEKLVLRTTNGMIKITEYDLAK